MIFENVVSKGERPYLPPNATSWKEREYNEIKKIKPRPLEKRDQGELWKEGSCKKKSDNFSIISSFHVISTTIFGN